MKKRIFYSITGVTLFSVCILTILITIIMHEQLFAKAKQDIKEETLRIQQVLNSSKEYDLNNIMISNRITIIQENGDVIFDNVKDLKKMDNHRERPEIVVLKTHPWGESTRLSNTLGQQTYYHAMKLDNGDILRLSITISSIYSIFIRTIPYIFLMAILVILVSMLISKYLTQKIIAPLYNIDEQSYDELSLFYKKIKMQQTYIETQKLNIEQKTDEFNIITENIADGFIVLNTQSDILSINKKAIHILGKKSRNYISKNIIELNRSENIRNAICQACSGKNSEIILDTEGKHYILHVSPVYNNKLVAGIVILLVDNTKKSELEKIRREFSANVSHELKTPLTSISGYAELIKTGLAKEDDIQNFAGKIYEEAQNLITLIQDIIKISRLDEQDLRNKKERVNLKEIIEKAIVRLDVIAKKKEIAFDLQLNIFKISGIRSVLEEAFFNILENAIKYNIQKGSILVRIFKSNNKIIIEISDTGIGISKENLPRIFERFYRVDTSHSKNIPGTGLGLAIVKHAINVHHGEIYVDSDVSKGTTVTIVFACSPIVPSE